MSIVERDGRKGYLNIISYSTGIVKSVGLTYNGLLIDVLMEIFNPTLELKAYASRTF